MYLAPVPPPTDNTFAKHWEYNALKYQPYFEVKKVQALANIAELRSKPLIGWDAVQRRSRIATIDTIYMRQQLGEISHDEVAELNRISQDGITFSRSRREPALLLGWNMKNIYLMTAIGLGLGFYGRFAKGYNNLWLIGGFLPGLTTMFANYFR